jgi:hypothetical protein
MVSWFVPWLTWIMILLLRLSHVAGMTAFFSPLFFLLISTGSWELFAWAGLKV